MPYLAQPCGFEQVFHDLGNAAETVSSGHYESKGYIRVFFIPAVISRGNRAIFQDAPCLQISLLTWTQQNLVVSQKHCDIHAQSHCKPLQPID